MHSFRIAICLFLSVAIFAGPSSVEAQDGDQISFANDVAPIINAKCGNCHVRGSRGRYNIKSYKALIDSDSVDPDNPDDSLFIEVIESGEMPKGGLKVSDAELETLKNWISQGAKFDGDSETAMISAGGGNARSNSRSGARSNSRSRSRTGRSQSRSNGRRNSGSRSGGRNSKPNAIEVNKLLAFLDSNGDGRLSLKEIDAAARILRSLDSNGDNRLTGNEVEEFGNGESN